MAHELEIGGRTCAGTVTFLEPGCVAPATRFKAALARAARHTLKDDTPVHSSSSLMAKLATIVRNTCRTPQAWPDASTFEVLTTPNANQQRAFDLIQQIRLWVCRQ